MKSKQRVNNWGNYPTIEANVISFENANSLPAHLVSVENIIPRGLGRCYGDSALASSIISTHNHNKFLAFDENTGIITCQSGVSFREIIDVFMPRGWFLPVTPGTKFITVGGAIASDVHGKNHHKYGSFCRHLISLELMTADGKIHRCSQTKNFDLLQITCGGMGLSGVILSATFSLQRIETAFIRQESHKARNLDKVMDLFEQTADSTYSVAWIDTLARGNSLGRSVLMLGEHAKLDELTSERHRKFPLVPSAKPKLAMPFFLPQFVLNQYSIKLFNELFYSKHPNKILKRIVDFDSFFFPLDFVQQWNRMYGKRGFVQYQFVLPLAASRQGMKKILDFSTSKNAGSFLAVLKLFGKQDDLISFPMEGYTLALDFPVTDGLWQFLDEMDRMVLDFGGRLYLTKDSRMKKLMFLQSYPRAQEFIDRIRAVNTSVFASLQSQRLGITP